MFNKTLDKVKGYVLGTRGEVNPLYQNLADYGMAVAAGTAAQQGLNWVLPGADPNPLVTGALMAPAIARGGRTIRGEMVGNTALSNRLLKEQMDNPFAKAALIGSVASGVGGLGSNTYNTFASGVDIDPNVAAGLLGVIAPISAYLLSRRNKAASPQSVPAMNYRNYQEQYQPPYPYI